MSSLHIAIISMRTSVAAVRASVTHAHSATPSAAVHVLDVDGSYRPVGTEHVLAPRQVGLEAARLHRMAVTRTARSLEQALYPVLLRRVLTSADVRTVLAVRPGVLLLADPTTMTTVARTEGLCAVTRSPHPLPHDGLWPDDADTARASSYSPGLVAIRGPSSDILDLWAVAADSDATGRRDTDDSDGTDDTWLDAALRDRPLCVLDEPTALLTAWNLPPGSTIAATAHGGLQLDGTEVIALDLSHVDPVHPWLLDAHTDRNPRGRLSEHPALGAFVQHFATDALADTVRDDSSSRATATPTAAGTAGWDVTTTALGTPVDAPLREAFRLLADDDDAPDPFDPATADDLRTWLTGPGPDGGLSRYLIGIHRSRPDLRMAFPHVPGTDTTAFLAWARMHAMTDGHAGPLLDLALAASAPAAGTSRTGRHPPSGRRPAPTRPTPGMLRTRRHRTIPGVTVVGYLGGGFGLGESARLMVSALDAAGITHDTVTVHPPGSTPSASEPAALTPPPSRALDTCLVCVNADLTPTVVASLPAPLAQAYRVGMWYWEVEDFPPQQHGGFAHVDEVWAATDFIRTAIASHSPVPVVTVAPPLPQRGATPTATRRDLGLPDRPFFLFTFDFLSTAERKNPVGLVDAFTAAFRPGEGPILVIKSINADARPADAERLRLRAASAPDVLLLEKRLDAADRDALVALCDCYVSLHRSEGLGLTMAEAMAWGKPVIATGYGGNVDFMTDDNSFLVPWTPTTIPPDAAPYPAGGTWADPDLDAASRYMRMVVDQPDVAAARGSRAAADIMTLHCPEVAGRAIAARLAETADRRRAHARSVLLRQLRAAARHVRDRFA